MLVERSPDLAEKYLQLGRERLRGIDGALRLLESNPGDTEALRDLRHYFHGFAGTGKTYGYPEVSELGRSGEEKVQGGHPPAEPVDLGGLRGIYARLRSQLVPEGGSVESAESAGSEAPLLNSAAFLNRARAAVADKRRTKESCPALVMLAIDDLAGLNDRYGTAAGARVLSALATLLRSRLRGRDGVARHRGDEIGVLLPETREEDAVRLLTRVLEEFAAVERRAPDGRAFRATFSGGVALLDREKMTVEEWLRVAESALDAARTIGPSQIVTSSSPAGSTLGAAEERTRPVLIVDDDEAAVLAYAESLKAGGLSVLAARSGPAALKLLETHRPELIIADVLMPGMDGFEFCRRVRQSGLESIPFLFCSQVGSLSERIAGLRMGADDYMVKPIVPEELLLKTLHLIERGRMQKSFVKPGGGRHESLLMAGELGEIDLPELLQIFELHGKTDVCIRLEARDRGRGEIYLSDGKVVHAGMGAMQGEKALFRMFDWGKGSFEAERKSCPGQPTLDIPLQELLLKTATQLDEFRLLRAHLSSRGDRLLVRRDAAPGISQREETTGTIVALIDKHGEIDRVLDASPLSDLITLRIIGQLLQTGVLAFPGQDQMANWWELHRAD